MKHFTKLHRKRISNALKLAYKKRPFCLATQAKFGYTGEKHLGWKGGRIIHAGGYIDIYAPFHPAGNGHHKYRLEHRLVMEAHINKISIARWIKYGRTGKYPKKAKFLTSKNIIHHINGDKHDNRLKNLMFFTNSACHTKFYHLGIGAFICKYCGKSQN